MRFSSAFLGDKSPESIINFFEKRNIKQIEFSNFPLQKDFENFCIHHQSEGFDFSLHNYFNKEEPKNDFVMNLASLDHNIAQKTFQKVVNAIVISKKIGSHFYALHAGFFLDLKINELGQAFSSEIYCKKDRKKAEDLFFHRLEELSEIAALHKIQLAIETNVCTKKNFQSYQFVNPFMLATDKQINKFIERKPRNVGILWDFGHVKVSAQTFGFNAKKTFDEIKRHVVGLHISDNNGLSDSNKCVSRKNWILREIVNFENVTFEISGSEMVDAQIKELHSLA